MKKKKILYALAIFFATILYSAEHDPIKNFCTGQYLESCEIHTASNKSKIYACEANLSSSACEKGE